MTGSFLDEPAGTREEIMRATYLALCEYGYAGLTVERIGEEFPKSKSLIYHHYEGKDDLLLDFLSFVIEYFEAEMPVGDATGADARLEAVLDHVLVTPLPDRRRDFRRAMVELRAQAAHDPEYREQFTRHDRFFRERIAALVAEGVEAGVFRAVDPEAVAAMLNTTLEGAIAASVTTEDPPVEAVREQVDEYVRAVLHAGPE